MGAQPHRVAPMVEHVAKAQQHAAQQKGAGVGAQSGGVGQIGVDLAVKLRFVETLRLRVASGFRTGRLRHVGRSLLQQGTQRLSRGGAFLHQRRESVVDRHQHREQRQQLPFELPDRRIDHPDGGRIEDREHTQRIQRHHGIENAAAVEQAGDLVLLALQRVLRPARHARQGRVQCPAERVARALRKDQVMHQRGAADADRDFQATRHRIVEGGIRCERGGQPDDRRRIAGQHADIGLWGVAQIDRDCRAEPDPERERETKQFRAVVEQRHEDQRGDRADHGSEHAVNRFRQHHARERLRDDIDRGHRPHRLGEIEPKRNVEGQHRCREALQRKYRFAPGQVLEGFQHAGRLEPGGQDLSYWVNRGFRRPCGSFIAGVSCSRHEMTRRP